MAKTALTGTRSSSRISDEECAEINDKLRLGSIGRILTFVWTTGCVLFFAYFLLRVEQDNNALKENDWRLHLPSGGTSPIIAEGRRENFGNLNEMEMNGYWKRGEREEGESEEEEHLEDKAGQTEPTAERGPRLSKMPITF